MGSERMDKPARYAPRLSPCVFIAVVPPLSGLLVSIVTWAVWVPLAASTTLGLEKWQFTTDGSEAQPNPSVVGKAADGGKCDRGRGILRCNHCDCRGIDGDIETGRCAVDGRRERLGRSVQRIPAIGRNDRVAAGSQIRIESGDAARIKRRRADCGRSAVKVTVPVGVGPELPMTVATRDTCEFVPEDDVAPKAVAVGMVLTNRLMAVEVLPVSFASPA